MKTAPKWLTKLGKDYWKKLSHDVPNLSAAKAEIFAVLCQTLSDYRESLLTNDTRQRKVMLDLVLKYAKEFGLTLKGQRTETVGDIEDELED